MPLWHQSPKLTPRYFLETPRLFGYPAYRSSGKSKLLIAFLNRFHSGGYLLIPLHFRLDRPCLIAIDRVVPSQISKSL